MVIKNARIIDLKGKKIIEGDIQITNGRITRIERGLMDPENTIDAKGLFLMYGMIDPHTFLGIAEDGVGYREFDLNESTNPATVAVYPSFAIHPQDPAIKEALSWGITSAVVMPGSSNVLAGTAAYIHNHGNTIHELLLKEPVFLKINLNRTPIYYYTSKDIIKTKMQIFAILRRHLLKAKEFLKKPEKKRKKEFDDNLKLLSEVLAGKLPIFAMVHRKEDIERIIEIKEEFGFNLVLGGCEEAHLAADLLKKHKVNCILGPLMRADKDPETKNTTFKTCAELERKGIKFALSHSQSENPVKILRFLAMYAHKAGMNRWEALKSITTNGYEIIKDSERGNIEKGKIADIVAFSDDPLSWKSKVVWTMINGHIVSRGEL